MTKHLKRPRTEHYTEPRGFFRRPPYFGEVEKTAYLIGAELEVKGGLLNKPTPEVYDQFGWPRPISPDMIKHGKPVTPKSPGRTPDFDETIVPRMQDAAETYRLERENANPAQRAFHRAQGMRITQDEYAGYIQRLLAAEGIESSTTTIKKRIIRPWQKRRRETRPPSASDLPP